MPKVTVIVPNYNHESFLRQRLESVLQQTFADFEVLLLDDASTDNSREVFQSFAGDPRIKVRLNKTNSGSPFKQWNRGLNEASGEYIWIAESDDFCDMSFLSQMITALDDHPTAGIAYCDSWMVKSVSGIDTQKRITEWYESFADGGRWLRDYFNEGRDELINYLIFKNTIPNASAVVMRRSIFDDNFRAPEDMRLAGDWMFWARVLLKADIVYIASPLNFFRAAHSSSQRSRTGSDALEVIEGLDVYAYIAEQVDLSPEVAQKCLRSQVQLWGHLAGLRGLSKSVNQEILEKLTAVHPQLLDSGYPSIWPAYYYHYLMAMISRVPLIKHLMPPLRRLRNRIRHRVTSRNRE